MKTKERKCKPIIKVRLFESISPDLAVTSTLKIYFASSSFSGPAQSPCDYSRNTSPCTSKIDTLMRLGLKYQVKGCCRFVEGDVHHSALIGCLETDERRETERQVLVPHKVRTTMMVTVNRKEKKNKVVCLAPRVSCNGAFHQEEPPNTIP